ncbi:hypothetical protein [Vulcaniibacterium tengchongense]|uniref:Uncharacterized protein n=1 Tax=Vulcaniibacterium tengchongense TaxID=1273429 RepID=A0A3N4VS63_9GAMM|nr:hypothetical protein [Vulcaniibacterium tengchongense]RPE75894.1 hypothetical protein EDC50_2795 [Vulcaniibacterium tengchongense]
MPTRYYIRLPDARRARGTEPSLSFTAAGAEAFAEQLQAALREPALFERWRALQDDPDEVDPALGAVDPNAVVTGRQKDLHVDLEVVSSLPGDVLRQRLRLLAGGGWELRDVTAA